MRRSIALAAIAIAAGATSAAAQWGWTAYGTAEFDTNETALLLAGASFAPVSRGWVPLVGVQAYTLRYPQAGGTTTLVGAQPYAGIQYNFGTGFFGVQAGYNFENAGAADAPGTIGDGTAGVAVATGQGAVIAAQYQNWGTESLATQGIVSYNLGSETFWGRARVTVPLPNTTTLRLGGEVALLSAAGTARNGNTGFQATSIGPILAWNTGRGVNLVFGAGRRLQDGDDATYVRAEIAIFPVR